MPTQVRTSAGAVTIPRPRPELVPRSVASWSRYRRRIVAADVAVIIAATLLAYSIRFNGPSENDDRGRLLLLVLVPMVWLSSMVVFRTYETRFLGLGSDEFDRVVRGATSSGAAIATLSWAFKLDIARGFVVVALPAATVATLISRYLLRRWLHLKRESGAYTQRVLLAGHRAGVEAMALQMARARYHGMEVAALCIPGGESSVGDDHVGVLGDTVSGIPVLGGLDDVAAVAIGEQIDAVAVLPCPELDGAALRRLGWALEETHAELYVAPAMTEVTGPRVAIRPIVGMPLLHVERPEFSGVRRFAKDLVDRFGAALGLLILAPALAIIAVAIRCDSSGPVFFRQARVGKDGRKFSMIKFRSMVTDAEHLLIDLRDAHDGNDVLFKMKQDPRVTRVGRILRRSSLDEIPQLVNVLLGQMSLVGPRPPLAAEVAMYGDDARRRLLVKPGLTGLWQISGRSDLDWDESIRLDLRYVENWSFAFDFMILWKTLGAVLGSRGAY